VQLAGGALSPNPTTLTALARAHPGLLWLIGNEPDVPWQDNVPAGEYARLYHDAYRAIKAGDPGALVAIGSIAEPTPLRLRYLDDMLAAYQAQFGTPAPVDVWNIHNYMLREERGAWGVDIPAGMSDTHGVPYETEDSGNVELFRRQIVAFRRWMAARGYRDRPLIVTEFGIPMPPDYGFPPERVVAFWTAATDFFRTATDPTLGLPEDRLHLVQAWCWFTLADTTYPTGNIFDPSTGEMTALGRAWGAYRSAQTH
jgi:hypothetical protein